MALDRLTLLVLILPTYKIWKVSIYLIGILFTKRNKAIEHLIDCTWHWGKVSANTWHYSPFNICSSQLKITSHFLKVIFPLTA